MAAIETTTNAQVQTNQMSGARRVNRRPGSNPEATVRVLYVQTPFKTCRCGRGFRPLEDAKRTECVACTQADLTLCYLAYAKTYEPRPEFDGRAG